MFLSLRVKKEKNIYRESLHLLTRQISDTLKVGKWTNEKKIRPVANIVINGMGGSNLAPEILCSIFKKELKIPVIIEPGYDLPGFVGKNTAYIVSSYSGTTEEPLAAYKKAKARGALVVAVTSTGGNKLSALVKKDGGTLFEFPTAANPSGQPRLGLGASLASFVLILEKLGALKSSVIKELAKANKKKTDETMPTVKQLKNREVIIISGPLFAGNAKTIRNQFNESGKNTASCLTISDMNHHALEGLSYPKSNRKHLAALIIRSKFDDLRIQKRTDISQEIFRRQNIPVAVVNLKSKTPLEQAIELLQYGGNLTYHIAIQNHVDPMSIPWVDWFKKKLSS